jgi:hypothetical protein
MNAYLVELYVSCAERHAVEHRAERVRRAAGEVTAAGTPVRFVRSIFVPRDETCLFLFEAASIEAVRETADRAALEHADVAEIQVQAYTSTEAVVPRTRHATRPTQRRYTT